MNNLDSGQSWTAWGAHNQGMRLADAMDGYTQYESEFVEETRQLAAHPECRAAATEIIEDVMERAMIEAAMSYGAAQTARETFLLDRLRKELIDSECRALFYKSALREPTR